MGGLTAPALVLHRPRARTLSLVALALGVVAGALDGVLIVGTQDDLSSLVWPLIVLPLLLVPLPVAVPLRPVRIAAATAMTGWCFLTGFSLGPLFTPCLLAMIAAAVTEDER